MLNKKGCIIVIEDDADDKFMLQEVFKELSCPNEIIFLTDGQAALDFLTNGKENPFLILSDINLPKLNGIELRLKLKNECGFAPQMYPLLIFYYGSQSPNGHRRVQHIRAGVFYKAD